MIDFATLNQLARQSEIDEFTILREYLQIHFLNQLYKRDDLKQTYFKGGTAIRLLFGSSRFSEDLDFTTQQNVSLIKIIIQEVVKSLSSEFPYLRQKEIKALQGYSVKLYLPTEISSQPLTIKLDFSQRESVLQPLVSPIETALPISSIVLVDHLSPEEILAEKIRAIFHRRKGRDLFDFWFLLSKNTFMNLKLIQAKFDFYKEQFSLADLTAAIKQMDEKEIDQDLRRFLPMSQRKIISQLKRLTLSKLNKT